MDKSVLNKFKNNKQFFYDKFNDYIIENTYNDYKNMNIYITLKFTKKPIDYKITFFSILLCILCMLILFVISLNIPEFLKENFSKTTATFSVLLIFVILNILYYFINIIYRKYIYYKYCTIDNFRIIAMSEKYKLAVFKIDENDDFIFEKEYHHLKDSFVKNIRYKTSYDIVDENNKIIENYELIEYNVAYFSPYAMVFRHKWLGYTYWNLNEMIEYYEKNGSPLTFVDKEYIYKNAKSF